MFASKDLFLTPPSGAYTISRSVRTRSSASAYFNRTFTTPTSTTKWTWSAWVKRGTLGISNPFFTPILAAGEGAAFNSSDQLVVSVNGAYLLVSAAVYRDPAAWYNIVLASDMSNATASLRFRVYINGVEITTWSTDARASYTSFPYWCQSGVVQNIGYSNAYPAYFDGYFTEINFVDGQTLTPSSFGATDAITGVWNPTKYNGSYGTNGFYLNFSDNSSNTATTIGKDSSGNGNNWTPNNISVTAGVTYDSMVDSPTVGLTACNYPVWNKLYVIPSNNAGTFTNGNLTVAPPGSEGSVVTSTVASMPLPTTGKWYWEVTPTVVATAAASRTQIGIMAQAQINYAMGNNPDCFAYTAQASFSKVTNATFTAYGSSYVANDVIGVAVDLDNGAIYFSLNGTWQNSGVPTSGASKTGAAFTTLTGSSIYYPAVGYWGTFAVNFGQRPLSYSAPSGYSLLNTQNLATPTISNGANYFNTVLRTGTGTADGQSQVISSLAFTPDLVWNKAYSNAFNHNLVDSNRGNDAILISNSSNAQTVVGTTGTQLQLTANGFTAIQRVSYQATNQNGVTYADWCWKAGSGTSSNTSGTVTSTVNAGATQGFSIATFTCPASGSFTFGHGLGVVPAMVIVKRWSNTSSWGVWSNGLAGGTYYLLLDTAGAQVNDVSVFFATPTSTVVNLGSAWTAAGAQNMVAYCFAAITGYSAFGKYTGNLSTDGPFVYTGFRPRFLMIKNITYGQPWIMIDTARNTYNVAGDYLQANSSGAQNSGSVVSTATALDILSNGFKIRNDASSSGYTNNGDCIYMAFAENPFKYSRAR